MLKEAIEKIVSLADNKTYDIHSDTYSDNNLVFIPPHKYRPDELSVGTLDGIVKLVRAERTKFAAPLFIYVSNYRTVGVFSTLDDQMKRNHIFEATCSDSDFREGFREQQAAIIELRSKFVPNEGSEYILELISSMSKDESVKSDDNGVTQAVKVASGIMLGRMERIEPRVVLRPYRTFREVSQPASEFLLRVDEDGRIGLFEADGGTWQLEARANIAGYLEAELSTEIADGSIIVMQ